MNEHITRLIVRTRVEHGGRLNDVLDWQYGLEPAHFVMERKTFSALSSVRRASPASRRIFSRSIKEANGLRLLSAEPF